MSEDTPLDPATPPPPASDAGLDDLDLMRELDEEFSALAQEIDRIANETHVDAEKRVADLLQLRQKHLEKSLERENMPEWQRRLHDAFDDSIKRLIAEATQKDGTGKLNFSLDSALLQKHGQPIFEALKKGAPEMLAAALSSFLNPGDKGSPATSPSTPSAKAGAASTPPSPAVTSAQETPADDDASRAAAPDTVSVGEDGTLNVVASAPDQPRINVKVDLGGLLGALFKPKKRAFRMTHADARLRWNRCRHTPGAGKGHYESYFQRANHPDEPRAFWIRYTIFDPAEGSGREALGELWGIYFDGARGQITSVRETRPLSTCRFSKTALDVEIGDSTLDDARLNGRAASDGHALGWSLRYGGGGPPLLLLPEKLYDGGFPKAKALVGRPNARFDGHLEVDGERVDIDGWVGSQNHNWGIRHTDHYAWGQVAGFDNAPDAFLEVSTARIRLGPIWSPFLTPMVLRLDGEEHALNSIPQALRAHGRFHYFHWSFDSRVGDVRIKGRIEAPSAAFTALTYFNPPGGAKVCLNSKIASCDLSFQRRGERPRLLYTSHRAAFEILTDDRTGHGLTI